MEETQEALPVETQQPVEAEPNKVEAQEEKPEDINWKAFREARKRDRLEREAAEKRAREKEAEAAALKAAMEAAFARQQQPQNYYNNATDQYETDEQRIEKLVAQALEKKEAERERNRRLQEQQEMPIRLRSTHTDFDSAVTEENLDYLEYHYPEIAGPLKRLPEGYDKWSDIYKAVKRFVPNSTTAAKEMAKAKANQALPKSISSTQITNTEHSPSSHRLTEQKRAENWQRMQRQLKGLD